MTAEIILNKAVTIKDREDLLRGDAAELLVVFFFNDTATTEIYTLSLHDALPISPPRVPCRSYRPPFAVPGPGSLPVPFPPLASPSSDRKSTRLNSSHLVISYAVFCLKKKNNSVFHSYIPSYALARLLLSQAFLSLSYITPSLLLL